MRATHPTREERVPDEATPAVVASASHDALLPTVYTAVAPCPTEGNDTMGGRSTSTRRRRSDTRQRPYRESRKRRMACDVQLQQGVGVRVCFELPVRALPLTLRDDLPQWARGGSCLLRACYVQLLVSDGETLTAWDPQYDSVSQVGSPPDHARVVQEMADLADAPIVRVTAEEAVHLVQQIKKPEQTPPVTFIAPAAFLEQAMRTMIAPGAARAECLYSPAAPAPQSGQHAAMEKAPIFEEFYYQLTGTTYDDVNEGRLYLAYATAVVDRLGGRQSGYVHPVWLTRKQVGQSMRWDRSMEQLDNLELRVQVQTHAMQRGADFAGDCVLSDVPAGETNAFEERYNRVPVRDPDSESPQPLQLFVSREDMQAATEGAATPTDVLLTVLERYARFPEALPASEQVPPYVLKELTACIREERRQMHKLNTTWRELYGDRPHPCPLAFTYEKAFAHRTSREWDTQQNKRIRVEWEEHIGYRFLFGLLATTPVLRGFVLAPRRGKPKQADYSRLPPEHRITSRFTS